MQTILIIFALCVIGFASADQSPLFIWGANSIAKPSLTRIHGDDFIKLVTPLLADKALIVFLENDLTNRDFICRSFADKKSYFENLQGVGNYTYYAAVENPAKALRSIAGEPEYNIIESSGILSKPLKTAAGNINFVKFNDVDTTRGNILKSHDSIIASVSSQLVNDDVFFVYTSAPATSLKRQRRDTALSSKHYVFRETSKLLLYFTSLSIVDQNSVTALEVKSMTVDSVNATYMPVTLTLDTGKTLTFDVTLAGGYFFMKNVMYNSIKFLSSEVYAPTDFSYFCGNLTLNNIVNDNVPAYTLKWNSLQFQAPFGKTNNTNFVFGDAWHCVGFFTGGILSGLLIVALLLTITFIGVCWMMDINTMDRFDDPKGKTITINASE